MTYTPPKNLKRYTEILKQKSPAQFRISQNIRLEFSKSDTTQTLWELHDEGIRELYRQIEDRTPPDEITRREPSLLDLKTELAERIIQNCTLCERLCRVNRREKERGYCGVEGVSRYASEFLHTGEEPELTPSHTIFLTGCNLRCIYCQNWEISTSPQMGEPILPERMIETITLRHLQGSKNLNLVTPTPHTHNILKTLQKLSINIPIIWNSNMYYTEETARLLEGIVDIYLGDFRYGNDQCATELSDAPEYREIVLRNFIRAYHSGEILMRHLVLPGHIECCTKKIIDLVKEDLPHIRFNLMFQYRPEYRAHRYPQINRYLSAGEKEAAIQYATKLEDLIV